MGKETAENLTAYIEEKIEKDIQQQTRHLATKEDLERGFKEQGRWQLSIFITLTIMILGLYATILLRS
ncbi:hypothetical protein FW774_00100 (plasmid) [Pedobacter sp. BS3]|uniref:hypothetical protein n=1 Tax=Pedobacter sp. BS3 TaxID=2567937 RepID=UPI0011ED5956|nr:hypothetical protein [Pedobacter sp. BS3]TZF85520.1 hypothetical protein FW774_00100 [Pedobacter sp. BS3]